MRYVPPPATERHRARGDGWGQRAVWVLLGLAALEIAHPTWAGNSVAQAVVAAGGWWIPLHCLLLVGYTSLVWLLWRLLAEPAAPVPPAQRAYRKVAQILALGFGICNAAFLTVDGLGVGWLAGSDPAAADALWNAPLVVGLANATGALWSAALLALAAATSTGKPGEPTTAAQRPAVTLGLAVTWLSFVAGAVVPAGGLASRVAALATGGWSVFSGGTRHLPFAVLVFAAVLRQHAGPEAALGMLCIALALFWQARLANER